MSLDRSLDDRWKTLAVGARGERARRSLDDLGNFSRAALCVDTTGARELLFSIDEQEVVEQFPRLRNIKVLVRKWTTEQGPERVLVIRCTEPETYRVFAKFAADLLEQTADSSDPIRTIRSVMAAWRETFQSGRGAEESALRGLYGELDLLRELMRHDPRVLRAWTGPLRTPQDFRSGRHALEVKSIVQRTNLVEVHGLEQLWTRDFDRLVLAVRQVVTDPKGEPLGELVADLRRLAMETSLLDERLGALDLPPETYSMDQDALRFAVRDTRYFLVTPGAGVLTPDRLVDGILPSAVRRLEYVVDVATPGFEPLGEEVVAELATAFAEAP